MIEVSILCIKNKTVYSTNGKCSLKNEFVLAGKTADLDTPLEDKKYFKMKSKFYSSQLTGIFTSRCEFSLLLTHTIILSSAYRDDCRYKLLMPSATSRQKPMLGTYKTRSATTNPTGKKRFVAGRNGKTSNAKH